MSVCVAIPVKDGARYLADAIESVLAQRGAEFEMHVVDNGSSDESIAIAESYGLRVSVNERDVNYYGSLNRALAETDAEFFVPFAADDLMRPGNLARKLEALRANDAGFAHSTAQLIDEDDRPIRLDPDHSATPPLTAPPDFIARIVPFNKVSCQSVVARTAALLSVGGFDARGYYAGDWLTWMRLSLRYGVATIAEPLVANRIHAASGTNESNGLGLNGRDIPATLDSVFRDPAMPADWQQARPSLLATALLTVARMLHESGIRRVGDGRWASYMAAGRAYLVRPGDAEVGAGYREAVHAAELAAPELPLAAVAGLPLDDGQAARLAAACSAAGSALGSLRIAVGVGSAEEALELLEPHFADLEELDAELVAGASLRQLLRPGSVLLAPWGSPEIEAAELGGIPVVPYDYPDLFATAPDTGLWQTTDPARCL